MVSAMKLARRLMQALPEEIGGAELHGYDKRITAPDVPFSRVRNHLRELFAAGQAQIVVVDIGCVCVVHLPEMACNSAPDRHSRDCVSYQCTHRQMPHHLLCVWQ